MIYFYQPLWILIIHNWDFHTWQDQSWHRLNKVNTQKIEKNILPTPSTPEIEFSVYY